MTRRRNDVAQKKKKAMAYGVCIDIEQMAAGVAEKGRPMKRPMMTIKLAMINELTNEKV